jgi:hypothetical protein
LNTGPDLRRMESTTRSPSPFSRTLEKYSRASFVPRMFRFCDHIYSLVNYNYSFKSSPTSQKFFSFTHLPRFVGFHCAFWTTVVSCSSTAIPWRCAFWTTSVSCSSTAIAWRSSRTGQFPVLAKISYKMAEGIAYTRPV